LLKERWNKKIQKEITWQNGLARHPKTEQRKELEKKRKEKKEKKKTFANREHCVVSAMDPYGRILGFIDWSHYYFFEVAPLKKSGSARN
jgi:hypothetical protein